MKKVAIFLLFTLLSTQFFAQAKQYTDVVTLKNGSVIKGIIIEEVPNESLTIETTDGSSTVKVLVSEVAKRAKEVVKPTDKPVEVVETPKTVAPITPPKPVETPKDPIVPSVGGYEGGTSYIGLSMNIMQPIGVFSEANFDKQFDETTASYHDANYAGIGFAINLDGAIMFSRKLPIGIGFSVGSQANTIWTDRMAIDFDSRVEDGYISNKSTPTYSCSSFLAGIALGLPLDAKKRFVLDARAMVGAAALRKTEIIFGLMQSGSEIGTNTFSYDAATALAFGGDLGIRFRLAKHFSLGLHGGYTGATFGTIPITQTIKSTDGSFYYSEVLDKKSYVDVKNITSGISLMVNF